MIRGALILFTCLLTGLAGCANQNSTKVPVSEGAINQLTGKESIILITYSSPAVIDPSMHHSGAGGIIEFAMIAAMQSSESIKDLIYRYELDDPALDLSKSVYTKLSENGFDIIHKKFRQPLPLTDNFAPYQKAFSPDLVLEIAVPTFTFNFSGFSKTYKNNHKSIARLIKLETGEVLFDIECSVSSIALNQKQMGLNNAELLKDTLNGVIQTCTERLLDKIQSNLNA